METAGQPDIRPYSITAKFLYHVVLAPFDSGRKCVRINCTQLVNR